MKKFLFYLILVGVLFLGIRLARGQVPNVISVDYNTATLSWDAGVGGDPADMFHIHCKVLAGADLPVVDVPAPATTIPIKSVITQTGKYECFVTASNTAGVSGASNLLRFDAGRKPAPPKNLRIVS